MSGERGRAWWRRVVAAVLEPRPRWWMRAWVWFLAALFAYEGSEFLLEIDAYGSRSAQWSLVETKSGELHWVGAQSASPEARLWQVTLELQFAFGRGYRGESVTSTVVSDPFAAKVTATPSDADRVLKWIVAHVQSGTGAANWDPRSINDNPLPRMLQLLGRPGMTEVRQAWWRLAAGLLRYLAVGVALLALIVGFVRGAQVAWYKLQLMRLGAGRCPSCAYELKGLPTGQCPECGVNIEPARREAEGMVRRSRARP